MGPIRVREETSERKVPNLPFTVGKDQKRRHLTMWVKEVGKVCTVPKENGRTNWYGPTPVKGSEDKFHVRVPGRGTRGSVP